MSRYILTFHQKMSSYYLFFGKSIYSVLFVFVYFAQKSPFRFHIGQDGKAHFAIEGHGTFLSLLHLHAENAIRIFAGQEIKKDLSQDRSAIAVRQVQILDPKTRLADFDGICDITVVSPFGFCLRRAIRESPLRILKGVFYIEGSNPSGPAVHLPLHKGGFGATETYSFSTLWEWEKPAADCSGLFPFFTTSVPKCSRRHKSPQPRSEGRPSPAVSSSRTRLRRL